MSNSDTRPSAAKELPTQAKNKSGAPASGKAFAQVDLDGHDFPPSPAPSSPRNGRRYALATELVFTEGSDQYNASSTPIYQACSSFNQYLRLLNWLQLLTS